MARLSKSTCAAAVIVALAGCAPRPALRAPDAGETPAAPSAATLVSILASTTTPDASRKAADKDIVALRGATDPTRLAVLEQILYAPGHSDVMRLYAMDQLAAADPARAGRALILYLPRMRGAVLAHACGLCVSLGDERLIDPLVRSLAGGMDDRPHPKDEAAWHARPEWNAISKLAAKPAPEALFAVVAHGTAIGGPESRIAALDILGDALTPAELLSSVASAQNAPDDAWLDNLRWWVTQFHTLPFGQDESAWISVLRLPENAPLVSRALDRAKFLQGQSDFIVAPRFVHVLAYASEADVHLSRAALLAKIKGRLDGLPHAQPFAPAPALAPPVESLAGNQALLSRCDLFAIDLFLDALSQPGTINELHRMGLTDMGGGGGGGGAADHHGGLLAFRNIDAPQLVITEYPPAYATQDGPYVPGERLLHDTVLGAALYHFHFQQIFNTAHAGPTAAELAAIRHDRCDGIVITSIATRKIDVDYYTPAGAIIDLGVRE